VTYPELGAVATPHGGLALSFDDSNIDSWFSARELFLAHGARATFFVTRYDLFSADGRAKLHQLEADGHAVGAHGLRHRNGPEYVSENGLRAYMNDEVLPSLELLRADGFAARVFAYPYGRRTSEMDAAVLEHVDRVRSVSFSIDGLISDPCPE
jgi:peptidoglycan/xylan/chitin deacetylase (PgdA/CDA1 family)